MMVAVWLLMGLVPVEKPAPTYVICDYYDFARDVGYKSRPFQLPAPAAPGTQDMPQFTAPFGKAIKAQFGFTPDARHLECAVVGPASLPAALKKDADPSLWEESERRVDWPAPEQP